MSDKHLYSMTLDLNILTHLGINLYSNIPSVLSEVVANAWDADATKVDIDIDKENGIIKITDNGHGMTREEVNRKYLTVGYRRRSEIGCEKTPILKRDVMGRKGIGKLSLFSVSQVIEVHTIKDGQKSALCMSADEIRRQIEGTDVENKGTYHPEPIDINNVIITKGTQIILKELKKGLHKTEPALRKRLARRFSILGEEHKFKVKINGIEISVEDRDYFHKIQFLWRYGEKSEKYLDFCKSKGKLDSDELREAQLTGGYEVIGWIGTVNQSGDLKDEHENLNKIVIMVRGKLAQEDILEDFSEGGVYSKYLIGEISADFLDRDDLDDISTTSRQKIIEDDPRYEALKSFIQTELKYIQNKWTNLRNKQGISKALEIPAINEWFRDLSPDNMRKAKSLFGRINEMTIDSEEQRKSLFKHGVIAFETLRYKENLDALEKISPDNLQSFIDIFSDIDDIEATLYYQITNGRLRVIEELQKKVDSDSREQIIQKYLFDHLWLLDPSWERVEGTEFMEKRVETEFAVVTESLSREERESRLDIKYRTASGRHIIIELKRPGRKLDKSELEKQVKKYMRALKKVLKNVGKENEPYEAICVIGKDLKDWEEEGRNSVDQSLSPMHIRVVKYDELIENAHNAYKDYFSERKQAGKIMELIKCIDTGDILD